ncbi:MAG: hypothetical protein ACXABY_37520 [Candidatus Thorarchaeota archaeon]|jgi:hypothetical protein
MKKQKQTLTAEEEMYEEMAELKPTRVIETDGDGAGPKTLEDKMSEAPDLSDLKYTIGRHFPEFTDTELNTLAGIAMVARVAPDAFVDLIYINVVNILQKHRPEEEIDVIGTMTKVYSIFSIGLDGKGRVDQIELHGTAREEKELEKLSRELF